MEPAKKPATRGRPPSITRERIVDAGIEMGLPNITFVGLAAALGVSHMALYKHVANLEALKAMVAEEIFTRWQIPQDCGDADGGLKDYLIVFATSVREFVKTHPGLTPYVIRRAAATAPMLAKIDGHQALIAPGEMGSPPAAPSATSGPACWLTRPSPGIRPPASSWKTRSKCRRSRPRPARCRSP